MILCILLLVMPLLLVRLSPMINSSMVSRYRWSSHRSFRKVAAHNWVKLKETVNHITTGLAQETIHRHWRMLINWWVGLTTKLATMVSSRSGLSVVWFGRWEGWKLRCL